MRTWAKRGLLALVAVAAGLYAWICVLSATLPRSVADWSLGQYRAAAKADRLEVVGVTDDADGTRSHAVVCRASIRGSELEPFKELWRRLRFEADDRSMCHEPVYRLKFYSGWFKRLDVTVCWQCFNMVPASLYPPVPNIGFDASTPEAKALVTALKARCPIAVSENDHAGDGKPIRGAKR